MRGHGTRACYVFGPESGGDTSNGCRCLLCKAAHSEYARYQQKRKRLEGLGRTSGPWAAPFVDAAAARAHVLALGDQGVGYKRVAELAGVGKTAVLQIRSGGRDRCRRETAAAILALPLDATTPADGQLVDARSTWRLVHAILRKRSWTKARLAKAIGQGRALQLGRRRVTARNARRIEEIAERLFIFRSEHKLAFEPLRRFGTVAELVLVTGVDRSTLNLWIRDGVPATAADALAVALGRHPIELWPDEYAVVSA